jgi:hypothetical protein
MNSFAESVEFRLAVTLKTGDTFDCTMDNTYSLNCQQPIKLCGFFFKFRIRGKIHSFLNNGRLQHFNTPSALIVSVF